LEERAYLKTIPFNFNHLSYNCYGKHRKEFAIFHWRPVYVVNNKIVYHHELDGETFVAADGKLYFRKNTVEEALKEGYDRQAPFQVFYFAPTWGPCSDISKGLDGVERARIMNFGRIHNFFSYAEEQPK
jgi:hypothetical protein